MEEDLRSAAQTDLAGGLKRSFWVDPRKTEVGFLETTDGVSLLKPQRGCWITLIDEKAVAMAPRLPSTQMPGLVFDGSRKEGKGAWNWKEGNEGGSIKEEERAEKARRERTGTTAWIGWQLINDEIEKCQTFLVQFLELELSCQNW